MGILRVLGFGFQVHGCRVGSLGFGGLFGQTSKLGGHHFVDLHAA